MKYRKKPVEIEAYYFEDGDTFLHDMANETLPHWIMEALNKNIIKLNIDEDYCIESLTIKTLEGDHLCSSDDYIIQGVKGELYPCKPDIFEMTYELVD